MLRGCPCCVNEEPRRGWPSCKRIFIITVFLQIIFVIFYYYCWNADRTGSVVTLSESTYEYQALPELEIELSPFQQSTGIKTYENVMYDDSKVDSDGKRDTPPRQIIDTNRLFPKLNFSDFEWTNSVDYFWNEFFENRYKMGNEKFPLKIIVIPHSHNDPGWGWTFEEYFEDKTELILNLAVEKLTQYPNMTFQWSEASFMNIWWSTANATQKSQLKKLVHDKRFEIVTGGWVMTDEAVVPLYSMIDQLVEGQHWFKYHLDISPQTSWSADPFGFGSTFPYLLKISGIDSMVILRIHYAWKKWMAENRRGDFHWVQRWDESKEFKILCHQVFYTMYILGNSLGPHSEICKKLDFLHEKKSLSVHNIESMAKDFVEEAGRTASLFDHNVALPILGADFTFRRKNDWDDSYKNYMMLFDYINSRKDEFNAEVSFGTLSDYFKVIRERQKDFPDITGDFFPYSDTESKPLRRTAYWSGFYSTRPFWKKMHRETEYSVRIAEILFTMANLISHEDTGTELSTSYPLLVTARQNLALFAHHDASPGVSSERVMYDYQQKLTVAIEHSFEVQIAALTKILKFGDSNAVKLAPLHGFSNPMPKYKDWKNKELNMKSHENLQILIFNSLGWEREEYVKLRVNSPNVGVMDSGGNFIKSQLNPVIQFNPPRNKTKISDTSYELVFVAKVPALSLPTILTIKQLPPDSSHIAEKSKLVSNTFEGTDTLFETTTGGSGDNDLYYMDNDILKLGFSTTTGFLNSMKSNGKEMKANMNFGGYYSVEYNSGPYLFMANQSPERIKVPFSSQRSPEIVAIRGPVSSELLVAHEPLELSVRILHGGGEDGRNAVFIENKFDTKKVPGEFFMRFDSDIQSNSKVGDGEEESEIFYTDQSGYTYQKRIKVDYIGVEGNYYPVTTMAFIQDDKSGQRLSLLVDRSHGAASLASGSLEVMIERRLLQDDNRGIGQGVMDNRLTTSNYILKLEKISLTNILGSGEETATPTIAVHHQSQSLNYPMSIFTMESPELIDPSKVVEFKLFDKDLPKDSLLLSLRTLPEFPTHNDEDDINSDSTTKIFAESCSSKALMIFHKLAFSCEEVNMSCLSNDESAEDDASNDGRLFQIRTKFHPDISSKRIQRTDLTGLRQYSNLFPNTTDQFEDLDAIYCRNNEICSFTLISKS